MDTEIHSEIFDKIKLQSHAYCDNRIAIIDVTRENYNPDTTTNVDTCLIAVCLKGKGSLKIDGRTFNINANDALICHPHISIENSTASSDVEARCICISVDYLQKLWLPNSEDTWNAIQLLERSPIITLEPHEVRDFCLYCDLIKRKLQEKPRNYHKRIIDGLIESFTYNIYNILERFYQATNNNKYTASDKVFGNFLNILNNEYPKARSVKHYADKLCITPKYLSSVCKNVCGVSASKLIERYMTKDIILLLKDHSKSIKEICHELHFPNTSAFGSYFRRQTSMSPKLYREHNK